MTSDLTRREALRRFGVGGSALLLPGLLAACGGDGGGPASGSPAARATDAEIDSISWGLVEPLLSLDPATGGSTGSWTVQALGHEGLLYLDKDFQLQPLLAESWEATSPKEYVFRLREGVTFWDGSPLTAEDVAFVFNRHVDPKVASHMAYYLVELDGAEATGTNEVRLTLKAPDPFIPYIMPLIRISSKAAIERLGERHGKPGGTRQTTMGTGPYRYASYSAENGVEVERNENYWGEKPRVRRATIRPIANPQTQLLAARSGEIEGLFGFDLQQARQWDSLRDVKPQYVRGMRTIYLCFNVQKPPFDDIHVRKAIVHAADRESYVRAFLSGHGVAAGPAISSRQQWKEPLFTEEQADEAYGSLTNLPYDMEAARAELAQSGYPDGFSAEIECPNHEPAACKAVVSLSESLKELGIDLRVKEVTSTKWSGDIAPANNDGLMFMTGSAVYPDAMQFVVSTYPSKAAEPGGYNLANYENPELDELIDKQLRLTDPDERREVVVEIFKIASADVPYMGIWFPDLALALNTKYVYDGFNCLYYANRGFLTNIRAAAT